VIDRVEAIVQLDTESWLVFEKPVQVLEAREAACVAQTIANAEFLARDRGYHAVGFVSYEAGAAFGLKTHTAPAGLALAWFALFDPGSVRRIGRVTASGDYELGVLTPSMTREVFTVAFNRIKQHLADGDSYQVNYTFRMACSFGGDPRALFRDLVAAQEGQHSAFIQTGTYSICSASPELFFSRKGEDLAARPMKGTARRGLTMAEDRGQAHALRSSPKQQAENVMVVDMVRNDLGRIAEVGSVKVPELFAVERYPNVWQMTSLVTARSSAPLQEIFAAMHPSASVTGAPKARTMEILAALEERPRGIYTGAIGHIGPDGDASFNVAIRTACVDHERSSVEFGIGSGIVWDSDADGEYEECLLKGTVLGHRPPSFELLETLRWTPAEKFFLFDRHLQRLRDSAEYFGFAFREAAIRHALDRAVERSERPRRVRLLVSRDGEVRVEHSAFLESPAVMRVVLAAEPIDQKDVFLFHKTTNRGVFERARSVKADEVILWNARGEVTEATTANVVVELGGSRVTPPVDCGLLAGTFRAELLTRGEIREAVVSIEQLKSASNIWLINSVHEWRTAVLS
jgi:para-aminobenzoate synthetase/4-amino-4-deoxychorismate lyase